MIYYLEERDSALTTIKQSPTQAWSASCLIDLYYDAAKIDLS